MKKPTVLIIGARSDIGKAIAHKFAALGYPIQLAARNVESIDSEKNDLELRYDVPVTIHEFDALETTTHEAFVTGLPKLPEIAVCAIGLMGKQIDDEHDIDATIRIIRANYEGPASIFTILANQFVSRGTGILVGISSVAGERGRASNYIYGSAKAGFTAFLSGMRNRLTKNGIHVITVQPGFVATKMTKDIDLPAVLTAQPSEVAEAIYRAITRKKNIIYVRPIWRLIMIAIRNIPENIFKLMRI